MKFEAIQHIPMSQQAHGIDPNHVVFRLRAGRDDLKHCTLFYADRACRLTPVIFSSVEMQVEALGIICHHEKQFMDAPTVVGGVNRLLKDEDCYVVMDVGGDHIGARAIGGYAPKLNKDNTIVYYVLNAYRPWSNDIDHIDGTLGQILGVSHIQLGKLHMVNNPNNGITTTAK